MSQDVTEYQVATPRLSQQTRKVLLIVLGVLILSGALLPNVAIIARPPSWRWLPGTAASFVGVTSSKLPGVDRDTVGLGLTVVFLGLSMWILGTMMTLISSWILLSADLNGWLWLFLLVGALVLAFSIPTVGIGKFFLDASNAPTTLGLAWLPTFLGAFPLLFWTLRGRRFIERTFYDVKPDLIS